MELVWDSNPTPRGSNDASRDSNDTPEKRRGSYQHSTRNISERQKGGIIVLRRMYGYTWEEIGDIVGCNRNSASVAYKNVEAKAGGSDKALVELLKAPPGPSDAGDPLIVRDNTPASREIPPLQTPPPQAFPLQTFPLQTSPSQTSPPGTSSSGTSPLLSSPPRTSMSPQTPQYEARSNLISHPAQTAPHPQTSRSAGLCAKL
ncbi:hypothetical protein EJ04DRAFT_522891 [Polyplosphaeria fusca]|uniref:Uncharacterized protein n=1 Tax=Polyplosphaeria fusca TaxID=682080 RepID=A0A9P4V4J7_9PLEO|nr:hypothetical protein EJ04DRAFT_522891 [Polyplosphaeria fusca]